LTSLVLSPVRLTFSFTGESIRDLIAQDVIQTKLGYRGHRTKIDNVLNHNHQPLQRIKEDFKAKKANLFHADMNTTEDKSAS